MSRELLYPFVEVFKGDLSLKLVLCEICVDYVGGHLQQPIAPAQGNPCVRCLSS